jgi:phenylalanyl-tRNA synthetase beta chain
MKISYNWLKDYLDFDQTPAEVADILTLTGLEVEETTQIGSLLEGVVVGEVLTAVQHPNADRLKACTVNVGTATLSIVCGAPNVAAGQKVAVATVGTILPISLPDGSPFEIRKSKIRGEVSEGMICAEDELGLGDDHDGIIVLDASLKPGTPISSVLDLNVDFVFEIGLTPNRPDASCHLGVARDLAAVINKPLKKPFSSLNAVSKSKLSDRISIEIKDSDKCHRYVGILIDDIKVKPSPAWLQNRIKAIGLRPINNIVDATNYVLHELGQPLHAFDYDLIADKSISVQSFDKETSFTTLDDQKRTVPAGSLFICDGQKPVALAGIMGGLNSEINDKTTRVLLESAYFEPVGVRKTSKQLALQTDSSYRFERGIDPNITYAAARRCAEIIADVADGQIVDGHVDIHPVVTEPRKVSLRLSRLNKILGMEFRLNQAVSILRGLEFEVKKNGGDEIECSVPTFRPDVTAEIDLIEEVARIFDYNNIPNPEYIQFSRPEPLPFREQFQGRIRDLVRSMGFREIYANSLLPEHVATSFSDKNDLVFTLNPISKDTSVLRPSLVPGLLRAAAFNFNRSVESVRFFEMGNVFTKDTKGTYHPGIGEETRVLFGLGGLKQSASWNSQATPYTVFDIKSCVHTLFDSLRVSSRLRFEKVSDTELSIFIDSTNVGNVVELTPVQRKSFDVDQALFAAELSITKLQAIVEKLPPQTFVPISKYPGIDFDMAILVDKTMDAIDLEQTIRASAGKLLVSLGTFDVFEGKSLGDNKKSIGFRLRFMDETKTLTIKDVDSIISKIVKKLEKNFQAQLRS